jgi:hypothetical protein
MGGVGLAWEESGLHGRWEFIQAHTAIQARCASKGLGPQPRPSHPRGDGSISGTPGRVSCPGVVPGAGGAFFSS